MSEASKRRSGEFLQISGQFQLGRLVTESSHPVTADLSSVAKTDVAAALKLLFTADQDVLVKFREIVASGRIETIAQAVAESVKKGGKIFLTGCGSTGRLSILLDSVWRDFCRKRGNPGWENRVFSVMAGGDYALIKSVEGFEDFTVFGCKQIRDLGVAAGDTVFAITEGGETSFVIGTAWAGVEAGAKVYFVYNNPDDILCETVERSREVIQDERIEKINLTTGPMAITGSTRMQATSIQLAVMLGILELVARRLFGERTEGVLAAQLAGVETFYAGLQHPDLLARLAKLVRMEEKIYRAGRRNNYHANRFGIDVLTDTTERSPTYCTPPFRKHDDAKAAESWAFLYVPEARTAEAWKRILKRSPRCVEWTETEVRALVKPEQFERTRETVAKISARELLRFRVGLDGINDRPPGDGCGAVVVVGERELQEWRDCWQHVVEHFFISGDETAALFFGTEFHFADLYNLVNQKDTTKELIFVNVPAAGLLLDGVTRLAVKLVMNAISTCTMVRLGRVLGNYMIWVVPSNLKLIDRATRYIVNLTGLGYEAANELLFEVIEYVEPRMKSDQAYPPVVGMAVLRYREKLTNEEAEAKLQRDGGMI